MNRVLATLAALTLATPLLADGHASGDADKGKKVFNKCKSCHMIQADGADDPIVKGGRTGPNLWNVAGRVPGTLDGFKYGASLASAAEVFPDGWTEAEFVSYVADPKKWLQTNLDDKKAKSKMSFKLKKEDDAKNVWAYLVSVGADS